MRRETRNIFQVGAAAVLVAVAGYALSSVTAEEARAGFGGVPATITYRLDFVEYEGAGELSTSTFELSMESWTDWRQTQTCCDSMTGYVQEWSPDGTMKSGFEEWDNGLLVTHRGAPGSLAVPIPEFSQGRAMTRAAVEALHGATLEEDAIAHWSEVLGIRTEEIVAYRVEGLVSVDGRLTGEATESHYVFYSTLRIPLHYSEYQDDTLVRELTVESIARP